MYSVKATAVHGRACGLAATAVTPSTTTATPAVTANSVSSGGPSVPPPSQHPHRGSPARSMERQARARQRTTTPPPFHRSSPKPTYDSPLLHSCPTDTTPTRRKRGLLHLCRHKSASPPPLQTQASRWDHMSFLAGSHRQSSSVLDLSRKVSLTPEVLKFGVPPLVARGVKDLRLDGSSLERSCCLPEIIDVVDELFPHLERLSFTDADARGESTRRRDKARARMRRLYVLYRLPRLVEVDGVAVGEDERRAANPRGPGGGCRIRKDGWVVVGTPEATMKASQGIVGVLEPRENRGWEGSESDPVTRLDATEPSLEDDGVASEGSGDRRILGLEDTVGLADTNIDDVCDYNAVEVTLSGGVVGSGESVGPGRLVVTSSSPTHPSEPDAAGGPPPVLLGMPKTPVKVQGAQESSVAEHSRVEAVVPAPWPQHPRSSQLTRPHEQNLSTQQHQSAVLPPNSTILGSQAVSKHQLQQHKRVLSKSLTSPFPRQFQEVKALAMAIVSDQKIDAQKKGSSTVERGLATAPTEAAAAARPESVLPVEIAVGAKSPEGGPTSPMSPLYNDAGIPPKVRLAVPSARATTPPRYPLRHPLPTAQKPANRCMPTPTSSRPPPSPASVNRREAVAGRNRRTPPARAALHRTGNGHAGVIGRGSALPGHQGGWRKNGKRAAMRMMRSGSPRSIMDKLAEEEEDSDTDEECSDCTGKDEVSGN